jgi:tripartite-type tricarboxylate transporter receptor subunit TctC
MINTQSSARPARRPSTLNAVPVLAALAALLPASAPMPAAAADSVAFPTRPVRIVVPYPPGGPNDILARLLGQKLGDAWTQPVLIDNRGGAGGNIGTAIVGRANPDGHTLLLHAIAFAVNPTLYGDAVPYRLAEFTPVSLVARGPILLTVHPGVPATSVKEFIALAKSKAGGLNYGSGGNGSSLHLAAELFKAQAGVPLTHIPYKGTGDLMSDFLAGRISAVFLSPLNAVPLVKQGKLRALAVTSPKRSPALPDLPTIAEAGVPGYDMEAWFALLTAAGTPRPVVNALSQHVGAALRAPDVLERLVALGVEAAPTTPEQAAAYIAREAKRWDVILRAAGVKAD